MECYRYKTFNHGIKEALLTLSDVPWSLSVVLVDHGRGNGAIG